MRLLTVLALLSLSACSEQSLETAKLSASNGVIYGEDSRTEIGTEKNLQQIAQAVSILVEARKIQTKVQSISLKANRLRDSYPLCSDEKFLDQPLLGFCTGVLIAPNKVLTAGHCMDSKDRCKDTRFIFGWTADKANQNLDSSQIYSCKQVLEIKNKRGGEDYAVVELDRETPITPVAIADNTVHAVGTPLLSLSYPLGLPLKKDLGRVLKDTAESKVIKVEVDTFSGSSGSPLFDSQGFLVGILSTGMDDFLEDDIYRVQTEGGCIRFNRCQNGTCFGETYTKVPLLDL